LSVIAVGAFALGGWVVFAPLSGAVIAPGYVKVDLNRKVVQHQEGGIVRAIRVRDGDKVKEGQELLLLDDVRIDAQLDLLRTQLDGERAKAGRLEAERSYAPKPKFPKDLAEQPRMTEIIERENACSGRGATRSRPRSRCCARRSRRACRKRRRSTSRLPPRKRRSGCRRKSWSPTSGCWSRAISRRRGS
jgi:multidrug efflux pump subunit AcrA (membrane-fusion protein)